MGEGPSASDRSGQDVRCSGKHPRRPAHRGEPAPVAARLVADASGEAALSIRAARGSSSSSHCSSSTSTPARAATKPISRVRVPYSPFFLSQVDEGHVKEITSKGTAVQGTFTQKVTYQDAKPTTRFRTEIPAFADENALSQPPPGQGRRRERRAAGQGARRGGRPAARVRPDCAVRLPALLADAPRRQRAERPRRVRPFAGAAVPAVGDRITFADVAGIDEAKEELSEVVDFLRNPEKYQRLGGADPARRPALRSAWYREDAARARGGGRGERAVLLDGGVRVRRGDRRRRRVARPRPLRAGEGGGAGDHLHRRARRDRPLAHVGGRGVQRRERRARADAEPDPHRDGRLRLVHQRDRDRRDEPPRRAGPGAAAARAASIGVSPYSHRTAPGARRS